MVDETPCSPGITGARDFTDLLKFVLQVSENRKGICHQLHCTKMILQCSPLVLLNLMDCLL